MDFTPVKIASDRFDKVILRRGSKKAQKEAREEFLNEVQIYCLGLAREIVKTEIATALAELEKKERGF